MFKAPTQVSMAHAEWCYHAVENGLVTTGLTFEWLGQEACGVRFLLFRVLAPFSLSQEAASSHLYCEASPQECILFPQGTWLWIAAPANREMATAHPGLG